MSKRDLHRLLTAARERGWQVDKTHSGHMRLRHPNGAQIFCPTTPSDAVHGLKNLKADLQRAERVHR
jgi:predicted RNA binding protein YcfA (HicA-like mRNA interferase family)